jgi:ABC-type Fe3+-siderophore transport system permease subunit
MTASAPATIGAAVHGERMTSGTFSRTVGSAWPFRLTLLALGVALMVSIIVAASVGAVAVPLRSVAGILLHRAGIWSHSLSRSATDATIVLDVRLPRVVTAALIGAALSAAGVLFQALLRNPLADPYSIGTSGGAALGATVGVILSGRLGAGWAGVPTLAFVGAIGTTLLVYSLARVGGKTPIVTLLLAGLSVSVILGYSMSLLLLMGDRFQRDLRILYVWLLGGVTIAPWSHVGVTAAIVLVGCACALGRTRRLNALALGDEASASLGLHVERERGLVILIGALLTAAAVSAGGLIGFVGLIVPHVGRVLVGPNHDRLLPLSILGGGIFLVLADLVARVALAPAEIPLGIVTAFTGGPLFLYLLRRTKQGYRF